MKYNTRETLSRAMRILGHEKVKRYQYNSSTINFYSKNQERVYVDNPMKVNLLNYLLIINECIVELFRRINYSKAEITGEDGYVFLFSTANDQFVDDIEYFKKVYEEDIIQIKKDEYIPQSDNA